MEFDVSEAQEKFELLMAMACNGEDVRIKNGDDIVRLVAIPETLVPGRIGTAWDFR